MNDRLIGSAGKPHSARWNWEAGLSSELRVPSQTADELPVNENQADSV